MKILCTGDWHFGLTVGGYDFHEDIVRAVQEIVDASDQADVLVHLGDVFHTNTPKPYVLSSVIALLDQIMIPSYFIAGNHDVSNNTITKWVDDEKQRIPAPDALEPLREIRYRHEIQFFNTPCLMDDFMFIPYMNDSFSMYTYNKQAQEIVDEKFLEAKELKVRAIFSHLDVDGAVVGSERAVLRGGNLVIPKIASMIDCAIVNGHIHKRQKVGNVLLPGSIVATDFSDVDGSWGYMILEI